MARWPCSRPTGWWPPSTPGSPRCHRRAPARSCTATSTTPEMARSQKVRALDLHQLGIVDRIVAEKPDAADEPEAFCQRVGAVLEHELADCALEGRARVLQPPPRGARYASSHQNSSGGSRVLEDPGDVGEEARALLAVDVPVVEGERERGDLADARSRPRRRSETTHGCLRTAPKHRIADSPGLMIGVPASTPKTPTLVIVNVPPHISAGWVLPSRAVAVSWLSAPASSSRERSCGVLDVGYDEPARGGRRDAEVDVVLVDDLLGGVVPERVDLRGPPHRQHHRAGQHQQRRDLDVAELAARLEPVDELHRAGDVDGDPLGDVRGGERGAHHRLRHHLATPLTARGSPARRPGRSDAGSRQPERTTSLWRPPRPPRRPGDGAVRARARDRAEVDARRPSSACLLGSRSDRRRA